MQHDPHAPDTNVIQLPAPTAYPMVMSLGITLICAGLVTNIVIGILGLILTVWSAVGWFLQVFPHEAHIPVAVEIEPIEISTTRTLGRRAPASEKPRLVIPVETFQITTGIKGGIAGGIAMTVPAGIFSLIKYHSFWYATNLLAAGGFVSWAGASDAFLSEFHLRGALAALVIHGLTSLLVGLLYGAMLPMFPRWPILTAGVAAPVMFTVILHSGINVISPILNQRIDWFWFFISLIAFGLVCGYVVNLHTKVRTPQFRALPFAVRAGLHTDTFPVIHVAAPEHEAQEQKDKDAQQ
ncbi:hypothetical protein [Granulicella aggregans]|jgi:hypothetical protein|uniref:hypothetical protein n=1 Tax=Granulicella aggregans TaxID=474949 RepID=UPI0021E0DD00|nr:hypothetical protein [Granulicella aggregans]